MIDPDLDAIIARVESVLPRLVLESQHQRQDDLFVVDKELELQAVRLEQDWVEMAQVVPLELHSHLAGWVVKV